MVSNFIPRIAGNLVVGKILEVRICGFWGTMCSPVHERITHSLKKWSDQVSFYFYFSVFRPSSRKHGSLTEQLVKVIDLLYCIACKLHYILVSITVLNLEVDTVFCFWWWYKKSWCRRLDKIVKCPFEFLWLNVNCKYLRSRNNLCVLMWWINNNLQRLWWSHCCDSFFLASSGENETKVSLILWTWVKLGRIPFVRKYLDND